MCVLYCTVLYVVGSAASMGSDMYSVSTDTAQEVQTGACAKRTHSAESHVKT